MKSNKGFTILETLIALSLILVAVIIVGNFMIYLAGHTVIIEDESYYIEKVNNHIATMYHADDWANLSNETISGERGDIRVNYEFEGETEYKTNRLKVITTFEQFEDEFSLERSVYYE